MQEFSKLLLSETATKPPKLRFASPDHTLHIIMATMAPPNPGVGEYDQYWRLVSYEKWTKAKLLSAIRSRGLVVSSSLTKDALIAIKRRLDRGLLYYRDKRISMKDLRKFVSARGLSLPTPASRDAIVNVLMDADEARTFDRFQDLPTELRVDIYEFYVDGFPDKLICPTQPPLTRTSKLMRKEALPVFYKSARFQLAFFYNQSQNTSKEKFTKGTLRPDFHTFSFLTQLSARPYHVLRKVAIDIGVTSVEGFNFVNSRVLVCAELTVQDKKNKIDKQISRVGTPNKHKELVANVRTKLKKSFKGGRRCKTMLKLKDIYAARGAAEKAFFATYQKMGEWN